MQKKLDTWAQFKGLQQDLPMSLHQNGFFSDAHNIRIIPTNAEDKLAITNERGTLNMQLQLGDDQQTDSILGTYLGHCVISKWVVIFIKKDSQENPDNIYALDTDNNWKIHSIAEGKFNFSLDHPIETLGVYENNLAIKVYWVDGLNQPRVINVAKYTATEQPERDSTKLDFIQELKLEEEIKVEKTAVSTGLFAPGVIQYSFSYYNRFGQETNIFYTTPLQYISNVDRGADPAKSVSNSFTITITNVDNSFEYLRIYSMHRAQIDGTPIVKIVDDIKIEDNCEINPNNGSFTITMTDNGMIGSIIDPTRLLYVGGESIIAGTFANKDNTLFLGNIKRQYNSINGTLIEKHIKDNFEEEESQGDNPTYKTKSGISTVITSTQQYSPYYRYSSFLADNAAGFKIGEHYLLGVQFQYKNGKWSSPISLGEYIVSNQPDPDQGTYNYPSMTVESDFTTLNKIIITSEIPASYETNEGGNFINDLMDEGYIKYRPVVVFPNIKDRLIVTQGIVLPTVKKIKQLSGQSKEESTSIDNQSSWITRLNLPISKTTDITDVLKWTNDSIPIKDSTKGFIPQYKHNEKILTGKYSEIQQDSVVSMSKYKISQSVVELYSPEAEFDNNLQTLDIQDLKFKVIGHSLFSSNASSIDIVATSPIGNTVGEKPDSDFVRYDNNAGNGLALWAAARTLINGPFYRDYIVDDYRDKNNKDDVTKTRFAKASGDNETVKDFQVFMWHNSKSLNNDTTRPVDDSQRSAVIKRKVISNLKVSDEIQYFGNNNIDAVTYKYADVKFYPKDSLISKLSIVKQYPISSYTTFRKESITYLGNVDTLSIPEDEPFKHFYKEIDVQKNQWESDLGKGEQDKDPYAGVGDFVEGLNKSYESARIKYKTPAHFVIGLNYEYDSDKDEWLEGILPVYNQSGSIEIDDPDSGKEIADIAYIDKDDYDLFPNFTDSDIVSILENLNKGTYIFMDKFKVAFKKVNLNARNMYNTGQEWFTETFTLVDDENPLNTGVIYRYIDPTNNSIRHYYAAKSYTNNDSNIWNHPTWGNHHDNGDLYPNWSDKQKLVVQLRGYYAGSPKQGEERTIWYFDEKIDAYDTDEQTITEYFYNEDTQETETRQKTIVIIKDLYESISPIDLNCERSNPVSTRTKAKFDPNRTLTMPPYLCLGELYRDSDDIKNAFNLPQDQIWLPAGEPKTLKRDSENLELDYIYGDTWFQRYDCLKTYPYDQEDTNQVVDIVSFMCETRINIDGRYDRNRGQINNVNMSPLNFNLINPVYSQQDNYFIYRVYPDWYYKLTDFPSTIIWTQTKHNGEEVDPWCNTTLANTLDFDGNYGAITKLLTHKSQLLSFQEKALATIKFNERVQLQANDGVPVELANSGKVDGYTYLNTHLGLTNKWALVEDNNGVFFIDSLSKSLYYINESVQEISSTKYMNSWFLKQESISSWSPSNYTFKLFYDLTHQDLYVTTKSECLNYSNILSNFTSFFDYENTPAMFNVGGEFYSFRNEKVDEQNQIRLYKMFSGDYNYFFNEYKEFFFEIVSNADGASDKIFTNLEYLADFDLGNDGIDNPDDEISFDTVQIYNEYQDSGSKPLKYDYRSVLCNQKKKFRTWRIQLPSNHNNPLERIRNTWAKIKLTSSKGENYKMILHSLITEYFI